MMDPISLEAKYTSLMSRIEKLPQPLNPSTLDLTSDLHGKSYPGTLNMNDENQTSRKQQAE